MTSKPLKKLAADSNVLLSAVIGKSALKIMTLPDLEFFTTQFNLEEVKEYIPHLASKYALSKAALFIQLNLLPLKILGEPHYKSALPEAKRHLCNRDPDDIHLGALALHEGIPIWSNDRDYQHFPTPLYTTAQLLKIFWS